MGIGEKINGNKVSKLHCLLMALHLDWIIHFMFTKTSEHPRIKIITEVVLGPKLCRTKTLRIKNGFQLNFPPNKTIKCFIGTFHKKNYAGCHIGKMVKHLGKKL